VNYSTGVYSEQMSDEAAENHYSVQLSILL